MYVFEAYLAITERMSRQDLEAVFLENLDVAERILRALARRHALQPDAAEDFAGWAKLKIIENDYAVIAKYRGESSLPTYLTVVIAMLFREYRAQQWGRWRPSAAARRIGPVGIKLETLTMRDGIPLEQAGQILRTAGLTSLTDRDLAAMVAQFPRRRPLRPVEFGAPETDQPSDARADETLEAEEIEAEARTAQEALAKTLATLPTEDRAIIRLHYQEGMSVADIARGLALPQKPLYRRLERALATLRAGLERAGISRQHVRELVTGPS